MRNVFKPRGILLAMLLVLALGPGAGSASAQEPQELCINEEQCLVIACQSTSEFCMEPAEDRVCVRGVCVTGLFARVNSTFTTVVETVAEAQRTLDNVNAIIDQVFRDVDAAVDAAKRPVVEAVDAAVAQAIATANRVCTPDKLGSPVCVEGLGGPIEDQDAALCRNEWTGFVYGEIRTCPTP